MTRISRLAAAAALSTGLVAAGAAAAQQGPMEGPMEGMTPGPMGGMMGGPMEGMMGGPMEGMMGGPMGMMGGMMGPMGGAHGIDFVAIDTDGNGSLSRAELQARAVERLAAADANGDGVLNRDELVAALGGQRSVFAHVFSADPAEGRADRLLALVGATETGQVEVAVLADRRVNMLLAWADTDRDAAISQAEANAVAARMADGHGRHERGGPGRDRGDRGGRGGERGDR